jgi:hypothetical protein
MVRKVKTEKWPKTIELKNAVELLAYASVEECIQGEEEAVEVAQYELVKVRNFRNVATEDGR